MGSAQQDWRNLFISLWRRSPLGNLFHHLLSANTERILGSARFDFYYFPVSVMTNFIRILLIGRRLLISRRPVSRGLLLLLVLTPIFGSPRFDHAFTFVFNLMYETNLPVHRATCLLHPLSLCRALNIFADHAKSCDSQS